MVLEHSLGQHASVGGPDFIRVRSSYGHLDISFRRTVRVADNRELNYLPPDLGAHALFGTAKHKHELSGDDKYGEYFFGMNHAEALSIYLHADDPFAVRIFVDGINAITGRSLGSETKDYIEVHGGRRVWLDGVAAWSTEAHMEVGGHILERRYRSSGAHQLVAVDYDCKASYASQVGPVASDSGIRIEVIPVRVVEYATTPFEIECKLLTTSPGDFTAIVHHNMTAREFLQVIADSMGDQTMLFRVIKAGVQIGFGHGCARLNDFVRLGDYSFEAGCAVHIGQRLRGGGKDKFHKDWHRRYRSLKIAPGGMIIQSFGYDLRSSIWDETSKLSFTTTMLGKKRFAQVTGSTLPYEAINEAAYSSLGLPYFEDYRDLKRQIRSNPALRGTYTALKDGVPVRSLGEMRDVLEPSQQIEVIPHTDETGVQSPRHVQLNVLDELKAQLSATSFTPESQKGVVRWSTAGRASEGKGKPPAAFQYDTSGTDDTDSEPQAKPQGSSSQVSDTSFESITANVPLTKRRAPRSRLGGLFKQKGADLSAKTK